MVSKFEARKFKLKIKITMINISCKFYVRKNDVTYTYYITLVVAIIRQQKLLIKKKKLPTIALSHRAKIKIINMRNSLCLLPGTNFSWKIKT